MVLKKEVQMLEETTKKKKKKDNVKNGKFK